MYIYQITNAKTGECYTGSSASIPMGRWSEHVRGLKRGKHINSRFQKSFNASGDLSAWIFRVLAVVDTQSERELRKIEAEWTIKTPAHLRLNSPSGVLISHEKQARIIEMLERGETYRTIRDIVGVSLGLISKVKASA